MGTRTVNATNATNSQADAQRLGWFVYLAWPGSPAYAHDGLGDIVRGGDTYLGVGDLGGISDIVEDPDLGVTSLTLTLTGVDPTLMALARTANVRGRAAEVWVRWLEPTPETTGELRFSGVMYRVSGSISAGSGILQVECVGEGKALQARPGRRRTDGSQRTVDSADAFYQYLEQLATREAQIWGGAPVRTPGSGRPDPGPGSGFDLP